MFTGRKFVHTEEMERRKVVQARELATAIFNLFRPDTVVDVGCGTGTLLGAMKRLGVKVHGYDGNWVNRSLMLQNIAEEEFTPVDLEKPLPSPKKVHLALCLEVAEHLSVGRAESLVSDLVAMADIVVFSAAIPRQGGQNHINEQWPSYWKVKFSKAGYVCYDVLKSVLWNNPNVLWWYRQNILVFSKFELDLPQEVKNAENYLDAVIHPELFNTVVDYREKNAIKRFARGLVKAFLFKVGLIK